MPCTCKFAGTTFAGAACAPFVGPWEYQVLRKHYWDLKGTTEIVGQKSLRVISTKILLFAAYTSAAQVLAAVETYQDKLIGENAHLVFTTPYVATFKYCTLDRITPIAYPGQEEPGALPDISGTLTGTADRWWMFAQFDFTQIKPS